MFWFGHKPATNEKVSEGSSQVWEMSRNLRSIERGRFVKKKNFLIKMGIGAEHKTEKKVYLKTVFEKPFGASPKLENS